MSLDALRGGLYGGLFSDSEVAALVDDAAAIRAMLAFEAALARAEAEVGLIPAEAAERIATAAEGLRLDPAELAAASARDGVPVPALVARLRAAVGGQAAAFVHWGATSQDVVDTAFVLNLRRVLDVMEGRLVRLCATLADLADRHRWTVMAARTRLQQATPTSFGLKAAGWLAPLLRHRERLAQLRPRVLVLAFGGASGNLAALGADALRVEEALARRLDLATAPMPWHTQRDGMAETAGWFALVAGALGKMAGDLALLAQSEVGEVRLSGAGGSSTMPNKANPVAAETMVALARHLATQAAGLHHATLQEHERGGAGWQLEWLGLPAMAVATAAALRHAQAALEGLVVDTARMRANLDAANGLVLAEAATFALAAHMARPAAQALVAEACQETAVTGTHLCDVLAGRTEAPVDWEALRDPARQLGPAQGLIDRVLAGVRGRPPRPTSITG